MKETEFIAQNKHKWAELERMKAKKKKDPERLSELFVETTNDLSYSRSFYPNRSIRVFLNGLALHVHSKVYGTSRGTFTKLKSMWLEKIPRAYYEAKKSVFHSFLIFFVSVFIGVFSSMHDPDFVGLMLSDGYIQMTLENIENGEPFAVYASDSHMDLFSIVTFNNIMVAFRVFVLGVFFMIGTVGALIHNGAMLGSFHYMFYEHGLLGESLITVWMHGMPEISAIVLAGAAGLQLGKGLLFTGTFSRKESFLLGARRGMLMMLGTVPVFLFAGIIEGFATRYTDIPNLLRIFFILSCLAFILYYFVFLPRQKAKGIKKSVAEERIPISKKHDYAVDEVKKHSQLFADSMAFYAEYMSQWLKPFLGYTLLYFLIVLAVNHEALVGLFEIQVGFRLEEIFEAMARGVSKLNILLSHRDLPLLFFVNTLAISLVIRQVSIALDRRFHGYSMESKKWTLSFRVLLLSAVFSSLFFLPSPGAFFLSIFVAPWLSLLLVSMFFGKETRNKVIAKAYGPTLGLQLVMIVSVLFALAFSNSGFTEMLINTVLESIHMDEEQYALIVISANASLSLWTGLMVLPLFLLCAYFTYRSSYEIITAENLRANIEEIGIRNRAYGVLRE